MGRLRAFSEDEVLDRAMDCFWRHGFEATSLRDLTGETGLHGTSLYNAFGDKRALFARALRHYAETVLRPQLQALESAQTPVAAILTLFRTLVDRSLSDPDRRGCFLVNAVLEIEPGDTQVASAVGEALNELEEFFHRNLARARSSGDIAADVDPRDTARMLLGLVIGLRVMARANPDPAVLEGMVRPALERLTSNLPQQSKGSP